MPTKSQTEDELTNNNIDINTKTIGVNAAARHFNMPGKILDIISPIPKNL